MTRNSGLTGSNWSLVSTTRVQAFKRFGVWQEIHTSGPWLGFRGFAIACRALGSKFQVHLQARFLASTGFEACGSEISLGLMSSQGLLF